MPHSPQGRPAPRTPPIVHKLEQRKAERVNHLYASRKAPNRTGWLDLAIGGVLVVILGVSFALLGGVR